MFAKCFLSLAVLLTPFTYAIWGVAEGEHTVQYLARELHEDTGVLRRGLCLLPQKHGLVKLDWSDKVSDEFDEDAAPVVPKDCRLALVTQIANYGEEIPFLLVKEKELVLHTPHFTDNVTYNLQSESMTVAQTVTDSLVEYLSAAEKYARTVPAEMCDFVRLAAALEPALISADLLHVYIDGQYRYTVLDLPAEPAAENLPMERPVDSFRRWWAELVKYKGARDDVDWLFESVICPHFCPQKSENTQNGRDKGSEIE